MDKQIVVYKTADDIRLEVQTDGETVWLTQEQMCRLFGRERSVITKHIANIFKEGELEREVVCAKFAHTTMHGAMKGKLQKKDVIAYNLDVVISVGYRVNSIRGVRFRQWATKEVVALFNFFSRKGRKVRKGVGMGREGAANPPRSIRL